MLFKRDGSAKTSPKVGCVLRLRNQNAKDLLVIGILLEKPRIKVGSMQRKLQKIRTFQDKSAIAVLKGYALIKNYLKEDKNYA